MKILFDIKEMKVGCPLLQAAFGCDSYITRDFKPESWFIAPTDDMKIYEVNENQLSMLKEKLNNENQN